MSTQKLDCVLIDDDSLMHHAWQWVAEQKRHTVRTFSTLNQFWVAQISFETPIFVDMDLGAGPTGLEVIEILRKAGYTNLKLCTGHSAQSLNKIGADVEIVSKDYPL